MSTVPIPISTLKISFNDSLIRCTSKREKGQKILKFIYNFSPSSGKIIKLEPICFFTSITHLSLTGHQFSDISSLTSLNKLTQINLSYNKISDITPLTSISGIEILILSHNQISIIPKSIVSLKRLHTLSLSFNKINDRNQICHLANNYELKKFNIDDNPLEIDKKNQFFIIYSIPHLLFLNSLKISREKRIKAAEMFSSIQGTLVSSYTSNQSNPKSISKALGKSYENDQTFFSTNLCSTENSTGSFQNQYQSAPVFIQSSDSTQMANSEIQSINLSLIRQAANAKSVIDDLQTENEILRAQNQNAQTTIQSIHLNVSNETNEKIKDLQIQLQKMRKQLIDSKLECSRLQEDLDHEKMINKKKVIQGSPENKGFKQSYRINNLEEQNKKLQTKIEQLQDEAKMHVKIIQHQKEMMKRNDSLNQFSSFPSFEKNDKLESDQLETSELISSDIFSPSKMNQEITNEIEQMENIRSLVQDSVKNIVNENNNQSQEMTKKINSLQSDLKNCFLELQKANLLIQNKTQENLELKELNESSTLKIEELKKLIESTKESNEKMRFDQIKKNQMLEDNIHQLEQKNLDLQNQLSDQKVIFMNEKEKLSLKNEQLEKSIEEKNKDPDKNIDLLLLEKDRKIQSLESERKILLSRISEEVQIRDKKIQELSSSLHNNNSTISYIEDDASISSSKVSNLYKENLEFKNKIQKQNGLINELNEALNIAHTQIKDLQKKVSHQNEIYNNQLSDQIKMQQEQIKKQQDQIIELRSKNRIIENEKSEILKREKELKNIASKEQFQNYEQLQQKFESKENEIAQCHQTIQNLQSDIEHQKKLSLVQSDEMKTKINELQKGIQKIVHEIYLIKPTFELDAIQFPIISSDPLSVDRTISILILAVQEMQKQHHELQEKFTHNKEKSKERKIDFAKKLENLANEMSLKNEKIRKLIIENEQMQKELIKVHDNAFQDESQKEFDNLKSSSTNSSINLQLKPSQTNLDSDADDSSIKELKEKLELSQASQKREHDEYNQTIETLNSQLSNKNSEISLLQEHVNNLQSFYDSIHSTIDQLENQCHEKDNTLANTIKETQSTIKTLHNQISVKDNLIAQMKENELKSIAQLSEIKSKLKQKENDYNILLVSHQTLCEDFKSQTAEKDRIIEKQQIAYNNIEKEFHTMNLSHKHSENKLITQNEQIEQKLTTSENAIEKFTSKLEKQKSNISKLEKENDNYIKEIQSLQNEISRLKRNIQIAETRSKKADEMRETTDHIFKLMTIKYNDLKAKDEAIKSQIEAEQNGSNAIVLQLEKEQKTKRKLSENIQKIEEEKKKLLEDSESNKNENLNLKKEIEILKKELDLSVHETISANSNSNSIQAYDINEILKENSLLKEENQKFRIEIDNISKDKASLNEKAIHEIENLKNENEKLQNQLSNSTDKIKSLQISIFENKKQKIEEYKQIIRSQNEKIEEQKLEIKSLNEIHQKEINLKSESILELKNQIISLQDTLIANGKQDGENKTQDLSEIKFLSNKNEELNKQVEFLQQKIQDKEFEIIDLKEKSEKIDFEMKNREQHLKQQINTLTITKKDSEHAKDDMLKQISSLKRDLREKASELEKQNQKFLDLETSYQELKAKLSHSVDVKSYTKLEEKYTTLKKLYEFNSGKSHTFLYEQFNKNENLCKEFAQKEDDLKDQLLQLKKIIEQKNEFIKRIQSQLQSDERRLNAFVENKPPFVPKIEVDELKRQIQEKDDQIDKIKNKCQEMHQIVDGLKVQLNDKNKEHSIHTQSQKSIINELDKKAHLLSSLISELSIIHRSISSQIFKNERPSKIIQLLVSYLNNIFEIVELRPISSKLNDDDEFIVSPNQSLSFVSILIAHDYSDMESNSNNHKSMLEYLLTIFNLLIQFNSTTSMLPRKDNAKELFNQILVLIECLKSSYYHQKIQNKFVQNEPKK